MCPFTWWGFHYLLFWSKLKSRQLLTQHFPLGHSFYLGSWMLWKDSRVNNPSWYAFWFSHFMTFSNTTTQSYRQDGINSRAYICFLVRSKNASMKLSKFLRDTPATDVRWRVKTLLSSQNYWTSRLRKRMRVLLYIKFRLLGTPRCPTSLDWSNELSSKSNSFPCSLMRDHL